jgi:hypothetical protein
VPGQLSQHNYAADRQAAVDGWHELSVANPTFLLERLGSECTDVQGLRELTVNGLDAIAALGDALSAAWCGTSTGNGSTPRAVRCASCRSQTPAPA